MGNLSTKSTKKQLVEIQTSNSNKSFTNGMLNEKKQSLSVKSTPRNKNAEFHKSLSMYELRRRRSRVEKGSITNESLPDTDNFIAEENGKLNPVYYSLKRLKANGKRLDDDIEGKRNSIMSSTSAHLPLSRQQSLRRDVHPIHPSHREIIVYCFENAHSDIGHRILLRIYERRKDYQKFIDVFGKDKWGQLTTRLKDYIEDIVLNLDSVGAIENLSIQYGKEHLELKSFGFKPDFWVSLADAITVECVILDHANHPPTDTVAAWSQLVSIMFTSIRDGYYSALRAHRINNRRSLKRQSTLNQVSSRDMEESNQDSPIESPLASGQVFSMPCIALKESQDITIKAERRVIIETDEPVRFE